MNPPWQPTDDDRKRITTLIAQGSTLEMCAHTIGVDVKTMKKHCHAEINEGRVYDDQLVLNRMA